MKHLIIFAHPHENSLNHSFLDSTTQALDKLGHEYIVRDLYKQNFQPVLTSEDTSRMKEGNTPEDIAVEQKYLIEADNVILIYPIWWTGLPAIIKGYIDRVFAFGFAYVHTEEGTMQLLKGKTGLIINTYGTPHDIYEQMNMNEAMRNTSDIGILDFTGIAPLDHLFFSDIGNLTESAYKKMIKDIEDRVTTLFK
ncbi:NAD(P)H-dependent oxidoreductase [Cytobacillus sp. FSL K6-0129]|uniref:NAD(P)H-dependent oxidoreductase n=1 Tax=Cytobacillus sp. FSL K6-0129 TaxID=2921421 RepID=UPI0030F84F5F